MKKINIEKKRQIVERSIRLYKDWLSTKNNKTIYEMKSILKVGSKSGGSTKLVECTKQMGQDGQSLIRIFQENWDLFGDTPPKAKINFMKLLEAETPKVKVNKEDSGSVVHSIETQYFPVSDRSNQMNSMETPNDRDLVVQIRNAATGGNMEIAKQLITSGWGSLSLKQRNGLIEWVNSIGAFNTKFDGQDYTAPDPSKKTLRMVPMKSRSDMTKNEFANGFVRTAIENSKLS